MKIYVILDRELLKDKDLVDVAKELIDGGVELIQYRDKVSSQNEILKNAERLRRLDFPLIINDYPQIAREIDAFGVHLGQGDMDIESAREILGENRDSDHFPPPMGGGKWSLSLFSLFSKIIGKSTHDLKQALEAEKEGADYIGIGPVFSTATKRGVTPIGLDVLKDVANVVKIPAFAIGGIALSNIDSVLATGIDKVAIASAILYSDNIKETVKRFKYGRDRVGINSKG